MTPGMTMTTMNYNHFICIQYEVKKNSRKTKTTCNQQSHARIDTLQTEQLLDLIAKRTLIKVVLFVTCGTTLRQFLGPQMQYLLNDSFSKRLNVINRG